MGWASVIDEILILIFYPNNNIFLNILETTISPKYFLKVQYF